MTYYEAIKNVCCRCRTFLQGDSRKGRQFILSAGGLLVIITVIWLVFPAEQVAPINKVPLEATETKEDFIPIGKGKHISRAELKNPFLPKAMRDKPIKSGERVLPGKPKVKAENVKLTGIISGTENTEIILTRGKESVVISNGETRAGITLLAVDEAGGSAVVDDGYGERTLYLGR